MIHITLHNIQSHAHTEFEFHSGGNFILANDNNVGKTTIMSTIAMVPVLHRSSNESRLELLRVKESNGYAQFVFDNNCVRMIISRRGESSTCGYFEQVDLDENGKPISDTIRTDKAPDSLIAKLDLKLDANTDTPLNIVEADAVKIIIEQTEQGDQLLSQILLDPKVEQVKANLIQFYSRINTDKKYLAMQYTERQRYVSSIPFNPFVDTFKYDYPVIEAAAMLADRGTSPLMKSELLDALPITEEQLLLLGVAGDLAVAFSDLPNEDEISITSDVLESICSSGELLLVTAELEDTNVIGVPDTLDAAADLVSALATLPAERTLTLETESISDTNNIVQLLFRVKLSCEKVRDETLMIDKLEMDIHRILEEIYSSGALVDCPMRGKVIYGETCVPVNV